MTDDKKKFNRPTKAQTLARREQVSYLRARGMTAQAILDELHGPVKEGKHTGSFPDVTIDVVFKDLQYLQDHAGEYIATKYLPQVGLHFQNAVANLEMVRAEAWRRYREGETETRMAETPKGTVSTVIHREGSAEWLRLAGMASLAIVKLGEQGMTAKVATQVMADYRRLKDLEKRGLLVEVAPVQPGS